MGKYDALFQEPQAQPKPGAAWLFPSASQQEGEGIGASAARVALGVGDVISTPDRFVAQARGMSMDDPNAYLFRPETEAAVAKAKADLAANPELMNYIPPGGFGGVPMMIPTPAMAPGLIEQGGRLASNPLAPLALGLKTMAQVPKWLESASPAIKEAVLRFASLKGEGAAVERAASKEGRRALAEGAKITPDELAAKLVPEIQATNAAEKAATGAAEARRQSLLEGAVGTPGDPYARGKAIQTTAQQGKISLGKAFQMEQDRVLKETGVADKSLRWKNRKGIPGQGAPSVRQPLENPIQREVVAYLDEIQYDPFKGYGTLGNRVVPPGAINELKQIYTLAGKARNTKDALDIRRLIDQRLNFGGEGNTPLFGRGSDEEFAVKTVRDRINGVIEKQFSRAIKNPQQAQDMAAAWRANNAHYSEVAGTLGDVSDQLTGKNAEQFLGKIQSIGADRMKALTETAAKNPEIAPVVQELKSGYVDNLILKATKDGRIDAAKLRALYSAPEAQEMNKVMISPAQRARFEFALSKFEKTKFPEAREVGVFFGGGKSDLKTASDVLGNISSYDKRYALKELEFLDMLAGRQGADKLSGKALAMSQARKLGMDEKGGLPILPNIFTGKFASGGAPGALLQSPAGAVLAFRALNWIKGPEINALRSLSQKAAKAAALDAAPKQDRLAPNAVPFRKVAEDSTMIQPQAMR